MKLIQTNICRDIHQEDPFRSQQRVIELEDGINLIEVYQLIKKNLGQPISDIGLVKHSQPYVKGLFIPKLEHPVLSKIDGLGRSFGVKGFRDDYKYMTLISVLED